MPCIMAAAPRFLPIRVNRCRRLIAFVVILDGTQMASQTAETGVIWIWMLGDCSAGFPLRIATRPIGQRKRYDATSRARLLRL